MGTILGSAIINKAATLLFDANNVKWARSELLSWVNDAQRAIVSMIPEANSTLLVHQLVAGVRQPLPAGTWMLLDVVRNMGTAGTTPGRAIQRVDRVTLDESNPSWQSATSAAEATVYMYSLRDRGAFLIYPPSTGSNRVELFYSKHPVDIAEASAIGVEDIYVPAIVDYVLARAFSKETQYGNPSKAAQYNQSFTLFVMANARDAASLAAAMGALGMNVAPTLGVAVGGGGAPA